MGLRGQALAMTRDPNYRLNRIHAKVEARNPELRQAVFKRDRYQCVDCGSQVSIELWHILPVIYGGKTMIDNLKTLCKHCRLHQRLEPQ